MAVVAWSVVGCEALKAQGVSYSGAPVVSFPQREFTVEQLHAAPERSSAAGSGSVRRVWKCHKDGRVSYSHVACAADSDYWDNAKVYVDVNTWEWERVKVNEKRISEVKAQAPEGGKPMAGMGPANSSSYKDCSGVTCGKLKP